MRSRVESSGLPAGRVAFATCLATALVGCGPTERSEASSSAPTTTSSPEMSTAATPTAPASASVSSSEPSKLSTSALPGPAPSVDSEPASGAVACGVFTAKFERVSKFQSVELFVPKSSAQLGPGLTWSTTCGGPAPPPGCMALRPSSWEAASRAALVEDATVDVGVDGTPRIVALVRTRMPPHSCYVLATLGLDGTPISGALLQGAIGTPRVATGEGMIGLRMFVARDEDPSAGAGAYPALVLAFATATPPTLEGPFARSVRRGARRPPVDARLEARRRGNARGARASWLVWVTRRGEALVAFASSYARSSDSVAPVELGVLTEPVEARDPFGERIALEPHHVAIGADLFRLEDGGEHPSPRCRAAQAPRCASRA